VRKKSYAAIQAASFRKKQYQSYKKLNKNQKPTKNQKTKTKTKTKTKKRPTLFLRHEEN